MSSIVYLVTGASRGIGLALVTLLAARPNTIVFAGARDPARATALQALAKSHPDRFHVVKLIVPDKDDHLAAAEEIKRIAGRLDVVIANAAFCGRLRLVSRPTPRGYGQAFRGAGRICKGIFTQVNTIGPLILFQTTYPLLKESKTPKFVTISSGMGSITFAGQTDVLAIPYGASKAAVNWDTRKLHHDFPDFIIFPISPGTVSTDGSRAAFENSPGTKELFEAFPPITPEESARATLEQIDVATRETHGGQFVDYTGLGKWEW
ncbi:hypothetical protein GGG16DRAFT_126982 [Schizophyllum commune]